MKKFMTIVVLAFFTGMSFAFAAKADSAQVACTKDKAKVQQALGKLFKVPLKIRDVSKSPVKGMCQVAVDTPTGVKILYTDPSLEYVIFGQVISVSRLENLTAAAIEQYAVLNKDQMDKLKKLVVFTEGSSKNHLYLVTDPKCPFCKELEKTLKPMIENHEIQISVLFRPLPFHEGADKISESIICDGKKLDAVMNEYQSGSSCDRAKKLLKETEQLLNEAHISAVPVLISDSGKYKVGAISKDDIEKLASSSF